MAIKTLPARSAAVCGIVLGLLVLNSRGQETKSAPKSSAGASTAAAADGDVRLPVAAPGDQVVIKRDPIRPVDPLRYRTALYLSPIRTVTLVAPFDGTVRNLTAKIGEALQAQAEAAKLDNTIPKFHFQRAQGLYKAAVLEQKLSSDGASSDQKDLAQARVDAAKADLDLAQYQMEQTSLRLPFAGEVLRFLVSEGQFVKAGDAVAVIGETSKLMVEIPVERGQIDRAKNYTIKIDADEVEAAVQSVMPLAEKFDPLRELFDSLTSAVLVVDNAKRNHQPGQTVFVPLIPRHPVAEVPSGAIGNRPDGGRKVQVLRGSVVRDVAVEIMASVGADRVFVNGPFAEGDEVIFSSSHQLADGFPVKASSGKTARNETRPGEGKADTKPATPAAGF